MVRLENRLWSLFSLYIRKRDGWKCITCGKTNPDHRLIHGGHFLSRRHKSIKFDPHNVHAQCSYCNLYLKGNVAVYADKIISLYGMEEFHRLLGDSRYVKQWTETEYKFLIDILRTKPESYEVEYYKLHGFIE